MPDHAIALYFGMAKFDEVLYQDKSGNWVQKAPDIPQAKQDCDDLRACFEKYNIRDEDQVLDLSCNPTLKEVNKAFSVIFQKLKAGKKASKKVNYLVIVFIAGHGVLKDGGQIILLNEFDRLNGYYKTYKIEVQLRWLAKNFPNSYIVGIFACCRQVFN